MQRPRGLIASVSLILLVPATTLAQSTWDGGGDGSSWSDAANWDPDGVPTDATDVLLEGGITITLDVAAETRDLTLDGATLDGPGDLTVTGHLDWIEGTVAGGSSATATITGSLTFVDGPPKILGRAIEAMCDVTWEHSDLLFDTDVAATFHHHAGFTLTITDETSRESGYEHRRADHRSAPLATVEDPLSDITDAYAFILDGDVAAGATATFAMSTDIGGAFTQAMGTAATFDGGSRFRAGAVYAQADASLSYLQRGTHLLEGVFADVSSTLPPVMTAGPQSTEVRIGTPVVPIEFRVDRARIAADIAATFPYLALQDDAVIDGPGTVTADEVTIDPSSSLSSIQMFTVVDAGKVDWMEGRIQLGEGGSLTVDELTIDHTSTARDIYGEVDPEDLAEVRVREKMTVVATASVPPRIELPFQLDAIAQLVLADATGLTFRSNVTLNGSVTVGEGSTLDVGTGTTTVSSTGSLDGNGTVEVSPNGTLALVDASDVSVAINLVGTLDVSGDNQAGSVSVDGGSVTGTGSLSATVRFDPDSPAQQAEVIGATVKLQDGSTWRSGSIRALDGGRVEVPEGQRFTVDHTATGLQIFDDGDPSEVEGLFVDGLLSIERSGSVPPGFNLPVTITPTGTFEVQPNMRATFPGVLRVEGTLRVRDGSNARFIFNVHEIATGGRVEGTGSISVQLGGELVIDGTVAPGENGEVGTLTYNGTYAMGPTATLEILIAPGVDTSTLTVNGATTVDGLLVTQFTQPPILGEDEHQIVSTGSMPGGAFTSIEVIGAPGTGVAVDGRLDGLFITSTTGSEFGGISGNVYIERDGDGKLSYSDRVVDTFFELTRTGPVTTATSGTVGGVYEFIGVESGTHDVAVTSFVTFAIPLDPPDGARDVVVDGDLVSGVDFAYQLMPDETHPVDSPADSGPGSLRAALDAINDSELPVHAVAIEVPIETLTASPLPIITDKTVLIGEWGVTEGRRGEAMLTIDGSACEGCDGLVLGGEGSVVAGITIQNFDGYGLVLDGGTDILARGNTITGNGTGGVLIRGGQRHAVYATDPSRANLINGNGGAGVTVLGGRAHAIAGNVIEDNAGLAIDLGGDGLTANDDLDVDLGPNDLQNAPEITGVNVDGTLVDGTLESRALTTYTIDVYGNATCHVSGTGQPTVHLASETVTTDASGTATFSIPSTPFEGELSATATDPDGSTSELSACFTADILDAEVGGPWAMVLPVGHPNPMRTSWALSFAIPDVSPVDARIFDVTGRQVRELHRGSLAAGAHRIAWDGLADGGGEVAAGVYFYELRIGGIPHRGRVIRVE